MAKPNDTTAARPALPVKWRDWRRHIYAWFAAGAVICTAGAFIESFTGLTVWSLHHGLAGRVGWLWNAPLLALLAPTMVDLVVLGGEAIWFLAVMDNWDRSRWVGPVMTIGGLAVSVAGNTGRDGWRVPGETLATYAVAPLSMAVMTGAGVILIKRHFGRAKRPPRAAQQQPPEPATAAAPPGETPGGGPRLVPDPPGGLAAQAEADARAHWPGRTAATAPGIREVKATLNCGQPRAERVIAAIGRLGAQARGA